MGKKQHQQDKLYLTSSEWKNFYGGKKTDLTTSNADTNEFRRLPFSCCALSFQPFKHPYCTLGGHVFDLENIVPFLKKYGKNPIDGIYLSDESGTIMSKVGNHAKKSKLAASIMMTLPGNPFIYYGDELGMNDEKIQNPDSTIYNHYTDLIRLRQLHPALKTGSLIEPSDDNVHVLSYIRYDSKEKENLLVIHNLSDDTQSAYIRELKSYDEKNIIHSTSNHDVMDKNLSKVQLSGYSTLIISLK